MSAYFGVLRLALAGVAILAPLSGVASGGPQTVTSEETVQSVRRMLERLPYYGVFDFLAFGVDRGTVTLVGFSYQGNLRADADMATKRARGVTEVANKIEELPASHSDDAIRWATFYRIYTDDFLSRYAPGGALGALHDLRDDQHFPGMQPVGVYAIHIIVRNGRTMLLGVVDSELDRRLAELRAREVTGVFDVENGLTVATAKRQEGAFE